MSSRRRCWCTVHFLYIHLSCPSHQPLLLFPQTEVVAEFVIPVRAMNILIEYSSFYESLKAAVAEKLVCPRCNKTVTDRHGMGECETHPSCKWLYRTCVSADLSWTNGHQGLAVFSVYRPSTLVFFPRYSAHART